MPPFLDRIQLHHALHDQALSLLEALAANDNLRNRSLTRFKRDDPPRYAESTESEELDDAPPSPLRGELPEELQSIMHQPIRTGELDHYCLESTIQPGDVYYTEAGLEQSRVSRYRANNKLRGVEGFQRLGVLVRHNIKRRWEQLGVWNSEWGFPDVGFSPTTTLQGGSGHGSNTRQTVLVLKISIRNTSLHAPYIYARTYVAVRAPPQSHARILKKIHPLPKPNLLSSLGLSLSFGSK